MFFKFSDQLVRAKFSHYSQTIYIYIFKAKLGWREKQGNKEIQNREGMKDKYWDNVQWIPLHHNSDLIPHFEDLLSEKSIIDILNKNHEIKNFLKYSTAFLLYKIKNELFIAVCEIVCVSSWSAARQKSLNLDVTLGNIFK